MRATLRYYNALWSVEHSWAVDRADRDPRVAAQTPTSSPVAEVQRAPRKGRLKQGVTRGVFARSGLSLEDMCREAARLGIEGFDLIGPADWPVLRKYGLTPSMYPGGSPDSARFPQARNV